MERLLAQLLEVNKVQEYENRLKKSLDNVGSKFSSVRTGRANPELLSSINVEYYGAVVPLQQLASITVSEGNTLQLSVFDGGSISSIEKSIQKSDLGLNPQVDGMVIRLRLPDLTQERREELVRYVKKLSEEGKIALRNIRRDELDDIKKQELSEDESKRSSDLVQKLLDEYIAKVDDLVKQKEEEIRKV